MHEPASIYLFDVDGTLTPAKSKMDKTFKKQFMEWMEGKSVYIISDNSLLHIMEQLGSDIVHKAEVIFACEDQRLIERKNTNRDWQIIAEGEDKARLASALSSKLNKRRARFFHNNSIPFCEHYSLTETLRSLGCEVVIVTSPQDTLNHILNEDA